MNTPDAIARVCAALSHPKRTEIFITLLPNAKDGLPYGDLAAHLNMPASTLSFHLKELEKGGVVQRETRGRQSIIRPCLENLNGVLNTLSRLCCPDPAPRQ
jgi:DNA-binding transcriptional ArsR family regulator